MIALEKQRKAHLEAARILLCQLRNAGNVWSDGRNVHRGEHLDALKSKTLMRVISLKEKNWRRRKAPEMHRLCSNLRCLPGKMKRNETESQTEWMTRLLINHCTANDIGSRERAKILRRLLRRSSPEAFKNVPGHLHRSKDEWNQLLKARRSKKWMLTEDFRCPEIGVFLEKNSEVFPTQGGFYHHGIGHQHIIDECFVSRKRPSPTTPEMFTAVNSYSDDLDCPGM